MIFCILMRQGQTHLTLTNYNVCFIHSDMGSEIWRDMKVIGEHVYIVSEFAEHGMQVFDLTQLRGLTADNTRVREFSRNCGSGCELLALECVLQGT